MDLTTDQIKSVLKDIDPDTLYKTGRDTTFSFLNGKLLIGKKWITHEDLYKKHSGCDDDEFVYDRCQLMEGDWILGRVGFYVWNRSNVIPVVTFWNGVNKYNKKEIKQCIKALIDKNIVKYNYWFVAGNEPVQLVGEFMSGIGLGVKPKYSSELLRKLHVMSPQAKKQIMDVNRTPKYVNRMPGVKWWTPKSESFREWLNLL